MNDLEERLREDLSAATDWLPDDVDPDAMLGLGRRARRSRMASRTVAAAATAVVVGLVGPAAWRSLQPIPGLPSPLQTISAVPSEPATPSDPLATTFDLSDQGLGKNGPLIRSVRVAVEPAGASVGVRVTVTSDGQAPVERSFTTEAGKAWHVAWDRHLIVGIFPGQANWFSVKDNSSKGVHSGGPQALSGIGGSAFWSYFEEPGGPASVRGFIWQDADGTVHDSLGNAVPSARVTLSDETYLVYQDVALDYLELRFSRDGGVYGTSVPTATDLMKGGAGYKSDGGTWVWTQYGVLPTGSHDVSLTLVGKNGEWAAAPMTDGSVAVVATLRGGSGPGSVVHSISYTDAHGKRVTRTVG